MAYSKHLPNGHYGPVTSNDILVNRLHIGWSSRKITMKLKHSYHLVTLKVSIVTVQGIARVREDAGVTRPTVVLVIISLAHTITYSA